MVYIKILALSLLLSSCCTSYRTAERRINRMVECNPSLIQNDTVYIPQITKEVVIDTAFYISAVDTVFFWDSITNTEVRIIRYYDTLGIYIHTPPDTIQVPLEVPRIVVQPCDKKDTHDWWKIIIFFLGGFLVLYAIRTLFK
jgi:hypothetical protein